MRRIPRPQRSIEVPIPSLHVLRPRITPSPCRAALTAYPCPRTTSAAFSTSIRYNFIDGKQDKKKHQQFVRRWQKRLLGESEPIGAHVDPYDPTSPVRISPEEQGEELEVLEEAKLDQYGKPIEADLYEEAESGEGLLRVGTKEWVAEQEEWRLIERFEKVLGRQFPLLEYTFGPETKVKTLDDLREKFHQAVVETYTLQKAGISVAAIPYPANAAYDPAWTASVTLQTDMHGRVKLNFPNRQVQEQSISFVGHLLGRVVAPPQQQKSAEEAEEPLSEVTEEVEADIPVKDSKSTSAKESEQKKGKAFDFMSNRPVPRTKPEQTANATEEVVTEAVEAQQVKVDLEGATEQSRRNTAAARRTVLESAAKESEDAVTAMRKAIQGNVTKLVSDETSVINPEIETKYRHIPLKNPNLKFAISKRLTQLTGLRISDPHLNSTQTLGDLYGHLVSASKPKPTKLYDQIRLEGKLHRNKKKPGMEQLPRLPNVKVYGRKISPMQKEKEVGRWKVIEYALTERGLPILAKDA